MQKAKPPSNGKSEEFSNFDRLFRRVVSVPKSAVEAEEAKERQMNRNERGRKQAAKKKP